MDGKKINYQFNEIQAILEQIVSDIEKLTGFIRAFILKARREGVSTYFTGRFFWKTANQKNRYSCLVTHEPEASDFLFKMQKRYYDNLPPEFKPATKYNNTKMLEFNTKDGNGLDSAIRVGTAGKSDFGSAQLIHYLHLSEVSKWPAENQSQLLISLLQCVPKEKDTAVVYESTAKGIGGEFYNGFWSCKYGYEIYLENGKPTWRRRINPNAKPDNEYCSIFIPWFVFAKYQMNPEPGFKRSKEEEDLAKVHGLTDRHLKWRRWAIENLCKGSEDLFKQEYPSTPREAFLSSGRPIFDNIKVEALMKAARPPMAKYEVMMSNGACIFNKDGRLWVWQEPVKGRSYIVSGDVAEGLEHGDFDSADVIDQLTGVQVAHWHGHIAPDLFGVLLMWIARRYNGAWIVPERNNHGLMTVTKLTDMKYPHVYAEKVIDPPHKPRMRYGWLTTKTTKFPIIDNLAAEIRQNLHGIQCYHTFEEMLSFKQKDDGTLGAEEGMWDDRVISIAIAKYVRTRLTPLAQENQQQVARTGVQLEGSPQVYVNLSGHI